MEHATSGIKLWNVSFNLLIDSIHKSNREIERIQFVVANVCKSVHLTDSAQDYIAKRIR